MNAPDHRPRRLFPRAGAQPVRGGWAYDAGMADALRDLRQRLRSRLILLFGLLAAMWLIELVNALFFGHRLIALGIHPRDPSALPGILLAPFLHAGFAHLLANTAPLAVLGGVILARSVRAFIGVSLIVALVGGLAVWLLGAGNSIHIGASGIVFGYFGYLLVRGITERSLSSIVIALVVGISYGSLLLGLLPGQRGVSWEGHLFGFLAGALAARVFADKSA